MYSQESLAGLLGKAHTIHDSALVMQDFVESAFRENPDNGIGFGKKLALWTAAKNEKEAVIRIYLSISRAYFYKGKSDSLQQYILSAQQVAKDASCKSLLPLIDLEWYQFHCFNRDWNNAIAAARKAISAIESLPESPLRSELLIKAYSRICTFYYLITPQYLLDRKDTSGKYSLLIKKELHNVHDTLKLFPHYYLVYARQYMHNPDFKSKLAFFHNTVCIFKSQRNYLNLLQCYQELYFTWRDKDDRMAMVYIDSAIYYTQSLNLILYKWLYFDDKFRVLQCLHEYKQAGVWYDSIMNLNSTIFSTEIAQRLALADRKYAVAELKAKSAEDEARSSSLIYGILLGFMLLMGLFSFAFYRYNIRQQVLNAEARRKTELADQRRIITEQLNRQISAERTEVNALLEEMLVRDKQNIPLNGLRNAVQSYLTGNTSRDQRRQKFTELYPDFFVNLLMQHPGLTPSEQDIAMFVAEGTSNTDMAEIFSWVNTDSAANRKSKLKVKLGFSSLPDLERYLSALK
ncbi:MAG: hypothetical protein V4543_03225 [Bacteroidota bacterium]